MFDQQQFLKSIFAGENAAFEKLYGECRNKFFATINKLHPGSSISLSDLYQESIMQFWSAIIDGDIAESGFKSVKNISSYIIEIGKNKFFEELRVQCKEDKLKKGERVFKKRTNKSDEPDDAEEGNSEFQLQSKKQQQEVERMTRINETVYLLYRKDQYDPFMDSDDSVERLREWSEFLRDKYEKLGYPCNQLLRDTWYNKMSDNEILEAFDGKFSNTDVIKTKRYKCHKTLLNMFNVWKESQQ